MAEILQYVTMYFSVKYYESIYTIIGRSTNRNGKTEDNMFNENINSNLHKSNDGFMNVVMIGF